MKQILRKHIKKVICGTTETITNERIEKELLTSDEINEICDMFGDNEDCYVNYGLMIDYNDELCAIDLDRLAIGLDEFITKNNDEEYPTLVVIQKKIEPWRAYDLDFESEVKP